MNFEPETLNYSMADSKTTNYIGHYHYFSTGNVTKLQRRLSEIRAKAERSQNKISLYYITISDGALTLYEDRPKRLFLVQVCNVSNTYGFRTCAIIQLQHTDLELKIDVVKHARVKQQSDINK